MQLSKTWKTVIGVLTVIQLFVGLFLAIWILTSFIPAIVAAQSGEAAEAYILASLGGLVIGVVIAGTISLAVLVFYLIHAGMNKQLNATMKVVWILLILFFGSIAEVIYFFMEVVPEKSMTARIEES